MKTIRPILGIGIALMLSCPLFATTRNWVSFAIAPEWDSYGIDADMYLNKVTTQTGYEAYGNAMTAGNPYHFDNVKLHDTLLALDFEGANYFEKEARFGLIYGVALQKKMRQDIDSDEIDSLLGGNLGLDEDDYKLGIKARLLLSYRWFFGDGQKLGIELDGGAFFKYISAENDNVDMKILYAGPSLQAAFLYNFTKHFGIRTGFRLDIPLSNNIKLDMDLSEKDVGGIPSSVASVTENKIYAEGTTGAAPIAYNLMPFIGVVYNY
ncbi:MAG: hypothetical protein SPF89_10970 [Sphaerochaetaceae bacterium]|nr:hypothetical protein [Spirochaetales bacterium]MDY5500616.1 hypothetical protein [Sphaerochaetaceae bacterium]